MFRKKIILFSLVIATLQASETFWERINRWKEQASDFRQSTGTAFQERFDQLSDQVSALKEFTVGSCSPAFKWTTTQASEFYQDPFGKTKSVLLPELSTVENLGLKMALSAAVGVAIFKGTHYMLSDKVALAAQKGAERAQVEVEKMFNDDVGPIVQEAATQVVEVVTKADYGAMAASLLGMCASIPLINNLYPRPVDSTFYKNYLRPTTLGTVKGFFKAPTFWTVTACTTASLAYLLRPSALSLGRIGWVSLVYGIPAAIYFADKQNVKIERADIEKKQGGSLKGGFHYINSLIESHPGYNQYHFDEKTCLELEKLYEKWIKTTLEDSEIDDYLKPKFHAGEDFETRIQSYLDVLTNNIKRCDYKTSFIARVMYICGLQNNESPIVTRLDAIAHYFNTHLERYNKFDEVNKFLESVQQSFYRHLHIAFNTYDGLRLHTGSYRDCLYVEWQLITVYSLLSKIKANWDNMARAKHRQEKK